MTCAQARQQQATPRPQFDAASVKPTDPNLRATLSTGVNLSAGGRLILHDVPLKVIVEIAYNVSYWQIAGGDAWTAKDSYDIEAVPPAAVSPSINLGHTWYSIQDEQLRAMLQTLLATRFKLQVRQDTELGTVYLLERSSKQLRLKPVDETGRPKGPGQAGFGSVGYVGGVWGLKSDMPQLAWFASSFILHASVTDRTGLQGTFYFRESSPDPNPQYSGEGQKSSFIEFLSEAGLKMVRAKGLVETLVIEHAEKPTPN